jgi:hypothetical protein
MAKLLKIAKTKDVPPGQAAAYTVQVDLMLKFGKICGENGVVFHKNHARAVPTLG